MNETFAPITTSIDRLVDTTQQKTRIKPMFMIKNEVKAEPKEEVKNESKSEPKASSNIKNIRLHDQYVNDNSRLKAAVSLPSLVQRRQNLKLKKEEEVNEEQKTDVIHLDELSDHEKMSVDNYSNYRRQSMIKEPMVNI